MLTSRYENAHLLSHLIRKTTLLPRQARDKHRESTQKTSCVFLQHDMLEEQKALIDRLIAHQGGGGTASSSTTPTGGAAAGVGLLATAAESPRGGAVQMLPSAASSLKDLYYETCVELGCGGADGRCRMHGPDCTGPNEKVAVTLSG